MDVKGLSGPGILWTASRIRRPDQLAWPAFLNWYDNDLIPRAMATSGIRTAFRATAANGDRERPNIVCVVLDDLAFCGSDEYKTIPEQYKTLPGSGSIWDLIDFENVYYSLLNVFDHGKQPISSTKSFLTVGWDLKGDVEKELDKWWTEDHCPQMAKLPGFLKTSRYRSKHCSWTAGDGATLPCTDYLEVLEFDTPEIDLAAVIEHADTSDEAKKVQLYIMDHCNMDMGIWNMEKTWGETTFR